MAYFIVEDDSAVADALQALLAGAGHHTRVFETAELLFASAPPGQSDTVVLDLGLPGISGSAVLGWLTALARPPRIIVISGKSSLHIERETGHLDAVRILRKPPAADWLDAMTN